MAWSSRMVSDNPFKPDLTVTMTLRITEIEIFGVEFTPTLRIGWLNNEFSVFSHWKILKRQGDKEGKLRCTIGWKSSLIKFVSRSTQTISLVLFQRVGETESPVALRTIPCSQIMGAPTQKHRFTKLPLMHLQGPARGNISGWIRCEEQVEENVQPNHWFGKVINDKVSETVSNSTPATQDSVDMSIDLTLEIPTVFYPFIRETDVFKGILEKHIETLIQHPFILKLLCNDVTRVSNGIVVDSDCKGPHHLFLALGMAPENAGSMQKNVWHVPNSGFDFDSLQFAAQEVAAQLCD